MLRDVREFQRDRLGFFAKRAAASSEPLVRLHLGLKPIYLVNNPDLIKPILQEDEAVLDKGRLIHKLRLVVGLSALTLSGEEYRRRRDVLHVPFARGNLERLIPVMSAEIRNVIAQWARTGRANLKEMCPPLALKLICVALFGRNVLGAADELALVEAVRSVEDELAEEMFRVLPRTPWAAASVRKRRAVAREVMRYVVAKARDSADETSILGALAGVGLSDEAISDELLTMLLAGHHTTGSTMAWLLYFIASGPHLADAIATEARDISDPDGNMQPRLLKLATMSLETVQETLRLYPSSWWFSRETRRRCELADVSLPEGATLIISPWLMHRDQRYWERPDRFQTGRDYSAKAYIPFGAGPRACMGMGLARLELQLLALEAASAFEFTAVDPAWPAAPKASVTLLPPDIDVEVRPRTHESLRRASRAAGG